MLRAGEQLKLLDVAEQLPNGFLYRPNFLTIDEEETLLAYIENLQMRQATYAVDVESEDEQLLVKTKRHIAGFGWGYDFQRERFIPGPPLPQFLLPLAKKIAKWLDIPSRAMVEALINDYAPGSGIGWHRDREAFEVIVGISLKSWARMRLRPLGSIGDKKAIVSFELEPRSAYLMQGASRWQWQHSVAPVRARRISITFRTLPTKSITVANRPKLGSRARLASPARKSGQ